VTIILPRFRRQTQFLIRKVSASRVARSPNGARLPLNRPGDHFAMEVDAKTLGAACGRELLADILRGNGETVRAYIPQIGIDPGAVGAPKVAGADQWGESLTLDGFTPYFAIRKGWFFTVVRAAFPSLHIVTAEVIADLDTTATIPFWPPLRTVTADNTEIELVEPWLEGSIDEGGDHETAGFKALTLDSFTIEEDG
jgi:hypothetical protein